MRALVSAILLLLTGPLAAQQADAPDIVVREALDPASGAVIGQHVALDVDVLFRGEMPHPPRVSLPEVPGLQIIRFETQATTMRETIGGVAYVGQRFEFALYPRRGGSFTIPPAIVQLLDRQGAATGSASGQAVSLNVSVPPGVDASQPVVATSRLTLDQQWDPAPTGRFKAGDAVVRTITRSAEDIPGLAMLDLDVTAPQGVRIYADPPDIVDRSNRGVVTGRRVDRITYVFERGGEFVLPALVQPWWDLGAHSLKTAQAEAATVTVENAPAAAPAGARRWTARALALPVAGLIALIALALAAQALWRRARVRRADPEREAFAALQRACESANAAEIYRCFSRWTAELPATQRRYAKMAAARLQETLFTAAPARWTQQDSDRLLASLRPLRRQHRLNAKISALPPLNPAPEPQQAEV